MGGDDILAPGRIWNSIGPPPRGRGRHLLSSNDTNGSWRFRPLEFGRTESRCSPMPFEAGRRDQPCDVRVTGTMRTAQGTAPRGADSQPRTAGARAEGPSQVGETGLPSRPTSPGTRPLLIRNPVPIHGRTRRTPVTDNNNDPTSTQTMEKNDQQRETSRTHALR